MLKNGKQKHALLIKGGFGYVLACNRNTGIVFKAQETGQICILNDLMDKYA
jgi:hypothetical protein